MIDSKLFDELCKVPPKCECGIGTYKEKSMHSILKYCCSEDASLHEQPYLRFVADVKNGDFIYEIQTAGFYRIREKLTAYLDSGCRVEVIYPVSKIRWLVRIDSESGEVLSRRKSGRCGLATDIFYELGYLSKLFGREGLSFRIVFAEIEEKRVPTIKRGRKVTHCDERIPVKYLGEYEIKNRNDVFALLPPLNDSFTAKELSSKLKLKGRKMSLALSFLLSQNVLTRDESRKPYKYSISRR